MSMQVIGKLFSVCHIRLGGNKMHIGLPQTINSGHGEIIQFKECIQEPDGARLFFEELFSQVVGQFSMYIFVRQKGLK